jgi:hypothetical protein
MFSRLLIILLMVTLALPIAALTPPNPTSEAPWSANVVAAKGKKHKQKKQKKRKKHKKRDTTQQTPTPMPTPTTVTRTVRGTVTRAFSSADAGLGPIAVPAGAPGVTKGIANPYPGAFPVSGFSNGVITDVDLVLQDFSHPVPEDVDILLVAPDGRRALVMSDAGRIFRVTNIDLTLDDEAAAPLTQMELDSGVYQPMDFSSPGDVPDAFPAPAPALDGSVALSTFDGADPNGTWQLFVVDDASGDAGDLRGWELWITAEVDTGTVEEQAPGS